MSTTTMEPEVVSAPTIDVTEFEKQFAPYDDNGDSTRKTHYVAPGDNLEFQAKFGRVKSGQHLVDLARDLGEEIVALCGYRWTPKVTGPAKFPVCGACATIAGNRLLGED